MISIFASPSYLGNRYHEFTSEDNLHRVSSKVRGEEISEYIGANLNSKRSDINIFVKPYSLNEVKDGDWVDFLDGGKYYDLLLKRPGVNIIASSQRSFEWLKDNLKNKIVLIPSHHLNFQRLHRKRKSRISGGYIGSPSPIATKIYDEVRLRFADIGMGFHTCFNYKVRDDAVNLFLKTDIFVIADFSKDYNPHKIPTKIINAASFGIPTIAFPLEGYKELEGYYIKANNLDEVMVEAEKLKNIDYYKGWSRSVLRMAEGYHISKIAELYKKL
jgi:hypothetical protein